MPDELDDDDPLGGPPFVAPFPTAEELVHMVVFRCTTCTEVVAIGDDPANYDDWLRQQIEVYGWTQGPTGLMCSDYSPAREPVEPGPPSRLTTTEEAAAHVPGELDDEIEW